MNTRAGFLWALLAAALVGQQPNTLNRDRMTFNGADGPPYPITGVLLTRGQIPTSHSVNLEGLPNAPFVVGGSNGTLIAGIPHPYGLIDLNLLSGFSIAVDGLSNPIWSIGGAGTFTGAFTIPATATLGFQRAFQGVVADFIAASGATLTAATVVVVAPGVTTVPLNVGSNSYVLFNLSPYGLQLPFYANTYSQLFVKQDGEVTFSSSDGDFTPTPAEFLSSFPRIAGMWTDLEPGTASTINIQIDESTPGLPAVQVNWNNLVEWNQSGSPHTFSIRILGAPIGDIQISQSVFNNAPGYDVLVGLSPGGNLSTAQQHPQKNLSNLNPATPYLGCPNENYHEWYGLVSFPYYTAGFDNPWDLVGRTLTFQRYSAQPGTPGGPTCGTSTQTGWGYIAF